MGNSNLVRETNRGKYWEGGEGEQITDLGLISTTIFPHVHGRFLPAVRSCASDGREPPKMMAYRRAAWASLWVLHTIQNCQGQLTCVGSMAEDVVRMLGNFTTCSSPARGMFRHISSTPKSNIARPCMRTDSRRAAYLPFSSLKPEERSRGRGGNLLSGLLT